MFMSKRVLRTMDDIIQRDLEALRRRRVQNRLAQQKWRRKLVQSTQQKLGIQDKKQDDSQKDQPTEHPMQQIEPSFPPSRPPSRPISPLLHIDDQSFAQSLLYCAQCRHVLDSSNVVSYQNTHPTERREHQSSESEQQLQYSSVQKLEEADNNQQYQLLSQPERGSSTVVPLPSPLPPLPTLEPEPLFDDGYFVDAENQLHRLDLELEDCLCKKLLSCPGRRVESTDANDRPIANQKKFMLEVSDSSMQETDYKKSTEPNILRQQSHLIPNLGLSRFLLRTKKGSIVPNPVPTLLENEDNPSTQSTALHLSVINGDKSLTLLLLEYGAQINAIDAQGHTALHLAIQGGRLDLIKLLLQKGADTEIYNQAGYTALHLAATSSLLEIVQLLLAKGANVDARTQ